MGGDSDLGWGEKRNTIDNVHWWGERRNRFRRKGGEKRPKSRGKNLLSSGKMRCEDSEGY